MQLATVPSLVLLLLTPQAESVHKSQALVMWEGLREDLAAGLQAVSSLDKELQHWIMQVRVTPVCSIRSVGVSALLRYPGPLGHTT